ncbi:type IX secretion system sortase PorU [Mesonia ostreae]|uniref:Type IX secretion system sortase PorU n=1 Tax=Mesonia ostreae TaxID=861110 RepID=A0ABU2KH31_9FLAO|nr:type IX secretion system sortase PorU [Mesonia ostreae]MDT0294016.1 type IX secretion system sortase PorU [Mesonia ostreae]
MMKYLYILFFLGTLSLSAQEKTILIPDDFQEKSNFSIDSKDRQMLYSSTWEENGGIGSLLVKNVSYAAGMGMLDLSQVDKNTIPSSPSVNLVSAKARDKNYFVASVNPLVKENGSIKRISSISFSYTKDSGRAVSFSSTPSVSNSVLASGEWARFYVPKTGVYKLSKSFLNNLGVDLSNPSSIKIYGHGGEMLPLRNNENEFFDLPQVSIQVVGAENGSFDSSDYILFYATAVHNSWSEENETTQNLYADRSYYYITTGGNPGLRVSAYAEPSGNAQTTIDTFDEEQIYEVDEYSVAKAGRKWFGDRFDVENERSYEFTFKNRIASEPVNIILDAVAASESATSMEVSINGQGLTSLTFGTITDDVYARPAIGSLTNQATVSGDDITLNLVYSNAGNPSSLAYLDYLRVQAKRSLKADNTQMQFTYKDAAVTTGIGEYVVQNTSSISQIWDITNNQNVKTIANLDNAPSLSFKAVMGEKRTYIAISPNDYYTPLKEANPNVANINLKGNIFKDNQGNFQDVDYLIVTNQSLMNQANRLAQFRRDQDGLSVKVVLAEDIYTEFNSGKKDIGAIRNFIKYIYDNASTPANRIKYVGLFGDASVDYKNRLQNNNDIVPTFEYLSSLVVSSSSAASDDFYGMMDPQEGTMGTADKLDIAMGRILADTPPLAKIWVDKIIAYESKESYGSWRNNFVLISDDAENLGAGGYGIQKTLDSLGNNISENKPFINVKKIHSDAFQQVSTSGGFRYPEVNEAISNAVEVGATVINYLGHGGENGLAAERIVTVQDIESWENENRYNVFVTVTCEFTRFDNPLRVSPGETNLFREKSGSVAMVTTTRSISVTDGVDFNNDFAPFLFNYNGADDSIAEAVRKGKNTLSSGGRVIFYFGDPAMRLQLPDPQVRLTAINDTPIGQSMDTIKALGYVKVAGELVNQGGSLLSNYNGELSTTIFDKRIDRTTLNNDDTDFFDFTTLGEIIFRGRASVNNGKFEFDFVAPKDIAIPVGNGRMSFYAEKGNALVDNKGYNNDIVVGGINEDAPEDNIGPKIKLYMNDESFVSGGITNSSPFLLAKLEDENGINTASGIGHDLVAILDGNETEPFVVNDFYETELDDFMRGTVNYKLRDLEEGLHTLTFKAWDVYNNSSTAEIQFMVAGSEDLKISNVLNYPNPFHNYTEFWFNHNRPFEPLDVQVQVFTVTGKVVWTRNQQINTKGFLSREITWNGKDDFGDAIGKGVYIYKLTVKSMLTNKKVEKFEKLVIL